VLHHRIHELRQNDVTEFRASGLSEAARKKVEKVIAEEKGELVFSGRPTSTLEELFLNIVAESEARPGRRVRGGGDDNDS
jgi:ABC-2 type transport system ATP-binding protein